jgi:TPR repeat protein
MLESISVETVSMSGVWQLKDMSRAWHYYDGAAPMDEIVAWCEQHLAGSYHYNNWETIYFTPQAHTFFLLRWS